MRSDSKERGVDEPEVEQTRRAFMARIAGAGAAVALGGTPVDSWTQDKPAAKPPADPPGTVPNPVVMAEKTPGMQTHSDRPLTGSVPAEHHNYAVTPNDRMFIRNNLLTPDLDAGKHRLVVRGLVEKELTYSLADLQKAFPVVTTQAMMECAGAGRSSYVPSASGTRWLATGGMGCPKWTGVRLRDVLRAAGLQGSAAHVAGQGGDFGVVATAAPV